MDYDGFVTLTSNNKIIQSNSSEHYNSAICSWSSMINALKFGLLAKFEEGYRKAASNTIVIGHHLAKLANKFEENTKEKGKLLHVSLFF